MFMTVRELCSNMEVAKASNTGNTNEVEEQRTVPVYQSTRARLRPLKQELTWDELVNEMADVYEEVR
ncbi:hypothetical protein SAMN04488063_1780 [Halopelagius inordinatus]|uniref:Uncharacterized protein n=2 Tax=Halopelagius inordinatus TaxID=553467 RepID=A0A1I2R412_9EURY|nr:hypothetical protein SAMN04488063_1780 [Halopelagius inordinatus]